MNLRKLFFAKSSGDATVVSSLICTIIGALAFYLMAVLMLDTTKIMDAKNEIYAVGDRYIQAMMMEGYLTDSDMAALNAELTELGCTGISYTGSSLSDVGYGGRLTLKIEYDLNVDVHAVTSIFSAEVHNRTIHSEYLRMATSYH